MDYPLPLSFEPIAWEDAKREWFSFLDQVERTRIDLNCSLSNSWFRGHVDSKCWKLKPSLLRGRLPLDPDIKQRLKALREETKDRRRKIDLWQDKINGIDRKMQAAVWENASDELKTKSERIKVQIRKQRDEIKAIKCIKDADCSRAKSKLDALFAERDLLGHKVRQLALEVLDPSRVKRSRIAELKTRIKVHSAEKEQLIARRGVIQSLGHGEKDAFSDWSFRSGYNYGSSWECLAHMQHHGAPTRLLDWSESLAVGVYFSLGAFRHALDNVWKEHAKETQLKDGQLPALMPIGLPQASLWVLNPYGLAGRAMGNKSILNPSLDPNNDYFRSFFLGENWPFKMPIPIHSPWTNHRIAAQGGLFTVWGRCRRSLDQQLNDESILKEVKIPPMAAVYGVRFVREFVGLSDFAVYRDLDNLGIRVREKFIDPTLRFR